MIPNFDMSNEKIRDRQKVANEIKNFNLPIFIWGCAETARVTNEKLKDMGITITAFVTDRNDVTRDDVIKKDDLIAKYSKYVLIRGFEWSFQFTDDEIKNMWKGCQAVFIISDCYDGTYTEDISKEFFIEHKSEFDEVYDNMSDELSKKSLAAFLKAKVLKDHRPIVPLVVRPQYFFAPSFWKSDSSDVLLDGGAFDGDSILNFVALSGDNYAKVIGCEPDPTNFEKLKQNLSEKKVKNFVALNVGLSDKKGSLKFNSTLGMSSNFSNSGDIEVPIDTIDNIANIHGGGEKISIIKLDVEKFEMPTLHGAENTIKNNRPIMTISAYHRRDDIFKIYQYLNSIVENYKFFFRCHGYIAMDAILYAIPIERLA